MHICDVFLEKLNQNSKLWYTLNHDGGAVINEYTRQVRCREIDAHPVMGVAIRTG